MSSQIRDTPSPVPTNFAAEVERLGLTNDQAARALGVSERQITRWRSGQVARHKFVVQMAEVFGRDTGWFYLEHSAGQDEQVAA